VPPTINARLFTSWSTFYEAFPAAQGSIECDFGVGWKGKPPYSAKYRLTLIENTGQIVLLKISAGGIPPESIEEACFAIESINVPPGWIELVGHVAEGGAQALELGRAVFAGYGEHVGADGLRWIKARVETWNLSAPRT
jgi:hypothetical protein